MMNSEKVRKPWFFDMRAAFAYTASRVLDIILNLEKCCMQYGYTGKILHVDLDNSKTEVEALF